MNKRMLVIVSSALFAISACSQKKSDLAEAEKKLNDIEMEIQQIKTKSSPEQRLAQLEKQVQDARKEVAAARGEAPVVQRAKEYVLPAGTTIRVRTTNALTTKTAEAGSTFEASLMEPVQMEGVQLIPAGAMATGVVRSSDPGGRVKGRASISIALKSIQLKDGSVPIETNTLGATAKGTVKRDVVRGGIMTGAGAAIGAIVGGGKGAAIGAGAGGAAGTGTAMATRGDAAAFAAETPLTFTLKAPATITIQP
jgi:hypothetical protein